MGLLIFLGWLVVGAMLGAFLLAKFKIPQHLWQVTEALPRLGTQKIDKRTLRTTYTELMETA